MSLDTGVGSPMASRGPSVFAPGEPASHPPGRATGPFLNGMLHPSDYLFPSVAPGADDYGVGSPVNPRPGVFS